MRQSNTESLGEVFKQYLKAIGAEKKMKEIKIKRSWEDYVGRAFASYTDDIFFKNGTLFIKMSSSAAKQELMMIKTELKDKLNKHSGENLINEIVIL